MTNETVLSQELSKSPKSLFFRSSFQGWIAIIATLLFVPFITWYVVKTDDEPYLNLICDSAQAISSFLTFLTAWHVSKNKLLDEETQKAWQRLTLAFFSYFCGQFLWFYLSSILGEEPFPSVADIGYAAFYPLMLWALRSFPTAPQTITERRKFWLDASIVMVSGLSIVWHFVIRPTIATGDEPIKIGLNLIYVVGDMILFLGIITILLKQPKDVSRRALYAIILGLIAISIADIGFAYYTLQNISPTGVWFDSFFTVSSYVMILAAFIQRKCSIQCASEEIDDKTDKTSRFVWLPYMAVLTGYVMLLIISYPYWSEPIGAFIFAAFSITFLVVLRQIISVKENLKLVAEQATEKGEQRLRSLLENSNDITKIIDEKGVFIYVSPAMEREFGYQVNDLLGTSIISLIHPEDKSGLIKTYLKNADDYKVNLKLEYRFKRADGSWRILEGIGKNVYDEEAQKGFTLVNTRDITERKEQENRLSEYTKKLQLSNRELQDFAFVASHDLQEPLRKVQSFGNRLESKFADKLGADGVDYLHRMQGASKRMQTLITDLLTFSRITSKAQPFGNHDLNLIVKDVLSDLEVKIEETKAEIILEDLPDLETDQTQMRQLFQNLIGNALKFSKKNVAPVIKISCKIAEPQSSDSIHKTVLDFTDSESEIPKGFCQIQVEDNGIGFDEKYSNQIFTVFQRLHNRTEYEGSGVGLAVCRKIVERHNGFIFVKSKPDEGSKFILTLPLKQTANNVLETS